MTEKKDGEVFDLDASLFMRVRRAVGRDESRFYLRGVYVEPKAEGGSWLVATDGTSMLVASDASAVSPHAAIIDLTLTEGLPRSCDDVDECECPRADDTYESARLVFPAECKDHPVVANLMVGSFTLRHAIAHEIDGQFPEWRRVWRPNATAHDLPDGSVYGIDLRRLARLAGDDAIYLRAAPGGAASQVLFR